MAAMNKITDQTSIDNLKGYLGDLPICSAFFVKNNRNKFFVGSSRHCFSFDEDKLLKVSDVFVKDFATQSIGRPTRIIAKDPKSDFFVFEVDFGAKTNIVQKNASSLSLGMLTNYNREPLYVYGFPSDKDRKGKPTRSENCETFPASHDPTWSKYFASNGSESTQKEDQKAVARQQSTHRGGADTSVLIWKNIFPIRHNCNIYGGNSGGPAVIANQPDIFIGVPISFSGNPNSVPRDQYGVLETPYWIIMNHSSTLDKEGINYLVVNLNAI